MSGGAQVAGNRLTGNLVTCCICLIFKVIGKLWLMCVCVCVYILRKDFPLAWRLSCVPDWLVRPVWMFYCHLKDWSSTLVLSHCRWKGGHVDLHDIMLLITTITSRSFLPCMHILHKRMSFIWMIIRHIIFIVSYIYSMFLRFFYNIDNIL